VLETITSLDQMSTNADDKQVIEAKKKEITSEECRSRIEQFWAEHYKNLHLSPKPDMLSIFKHYSKGNFDEEDLKEESSSTTESTSFLDTTSLSSFSADNEFNDVEPYLVDKPDPYYSSERSTYQYFEVGPDFLGHKYNKAVHDVPIPLHDVIIKIEFVHN
jgi:hypothetical protein